MKNILVLGGHLDDGIIAAGGTLRKFIEAGCRVSVVCFGNGDEGFNDVSQRDRAAEQFTAQAVEAHQVLGVQDFVCHNLPDYAVQENRETYRLCIEAIRRTQPDIIFGHYWLEYFQHRAMARLTCDSWWQAGWDSSADLGRPWQARAMYHFEVLHPLPEPTHFVDITSTFEAKVEASKKFVATQTDLGDFVSRMEARARFHGSSIGVKYAEVFKRSYFVPDKVLDVMEGL